MKTKELIKKLHDHGFDVSKVFENDEMKSVNANSDGFSIEVPVGATNWLEIYTLGGSELNTKQADIASTLVTEYLNTPVDKRGEEKKYTVQVSKDDKEGYLNRDECDDIFMIAGLDCDGEWHNTFTQSEIEQLKQRNLAVDWDKAIIKEAKHEKD